MTYWIGIVVSGVCLLAVSGLALFFIGMVFLQAGKELVGAVKKKLT